MYNSLFSATLVARIQAQTRAGAFAECPAAFALVAAANVGPDAEDDCTDIELDEAGRPYPGKRSSTGQPGPAEEAAADAP